MTDWLSLIINVAGIGAITQSVGLPLHQGIYALLNGVGIHLTERREPLRDTGGAAGLFWRRWHTHRRHVFVRRRFQPILAPRESATNSPILDLCSLVQLSNSS